MVHTELNPHLLLMLAPLLVIELGLMIFALIKLIRASKTRFFNKAIWALLIIFIHLIGPILYLVLEGGGAHDSSD